MIQIIKKNFTWISPSICAGTGFPSPADDYIDHPLDWNEFLIARPAATFTVRVMGQSMSPLIPDGAHVVVDKSLTAQSGDIVVAIFNGEFTLKQYVRKNDTHYLIPYNSSFSTITIQKEDEFEVWGVVTFSIQSHR